MSAEAVTPRFHERIGAWEAEYLSPLAARSYPARREQPEDDSPLRTPFQRDRDRIVHSKAFRRLKHKTQVFISPEGDHYRTRLTHTLEACGIARTVARALGLNEDLTEAIALGHDLGHPPFGHIGENVLDQCLLERYGVRGERAGEARDRLRTFMFERVYLGHAVQAEHGRIERMLRALFEHYAEHPPPAIAAEASELERVVDWLAGMTDRFAVRVFAELSLPQGF